MDEGSSLRYIESQSASIHYLYGVKDVIFLGRSTFQEVEILRLGDFGLTLFLDRKIQSAEVDEFIYHEALVHPAMVSHPDPRKVLILGGGEGATLREVLRHNTVDRAVMVDIDEKLVGLCREHLPSWSNGAFDHPKTELVFCDARDYVQGAEEKFDVIISDLTEPVHGGPSTKLFTKEFFEMISRALEDDGIFVLQAGSVDPVWLRFFSDVCATLGETFPIVRPLQVFILSFQMPWGLLMTSKSGDPRELTDEGIAHILEDRGIGLLRYYQPSLHTSLFGTPKYLDEAIARGEVLTDAQPYILDA
jgi:spermidine synthase